jgi:hypothetical protein
MTLPSQTTELRRSFFGDSPDAARDAASAWLRDFDAHGPFDIHAISTSKDDGRFIATVTYSEASIVIRPHERLKEEAPVKPSWKLRDALLPALARCNQIKSELRLRCDEVADGLRLLLTPASAPSGLGAQDGADTLWNVTDFGDGALQTSLGVRKNNASGHRSQQDDIRNSLDRARDAARRAQMQSGRHRTPPSHAR